MAVTIDGANIVVLAVLVWYLGSLVNKLLPLLDRYAIPVAVTGGLLCSLAVAAIHYLFGLQILFDTGLRDLLLLAFFSTIGLSAKLATLREGGRALVVLLIAAAVLLVLQDVTGVALALALGAHPGFGVMGGSVSLAGGHGTAIAWGDVAEAAGLAGAKEWGIAFATLGLIAGGLIGGPLAQRMIRRNAIAGRRDPLADAALPDLTAAPDLQPPVSSALTTLALLALCIEGGHWVNLLLSAEGFTLPGFLTAMLIGILLTNLADLVRVKLDAVALQRASDISLQLFLAMSLMSMQLWLIASAFGQILLILFAQILVITLFVDWVVFRLMGRDYDAAVIAAGFAGMGLGATPVGIANMAAVTAKFGPSPKAFLVIPLVGAFFLDLMNALVIKFFLGLPFMQAAGD